MRSRFVVCFVMVLLMGCRALSGVPFTTDVAPTALPTGVAWGERVAFGKPIAKFEVIVGNSVVSSGTFNPAREALDLPNAPIFPVFNGAPDPISSELFAKPLTAAERVLYENRGKVRLSFMGAPQETLTPYGAVVPGQIQVLASVANSCSSLFSLSFPNGLVIINTLEVSLSTTTKLCHITFDIGNQDTAGALTALEAQLARSSVPFTSSVGEAGFVVDTNSLSSLDQTGGKKLTDPSCEQIKKWLDPIAARSYGLIDMEKLRTDIMAKDVAQRGTGVQVVLIGSGIGQSDDFSCPDFFKKHDEHVRVIIQAIAPSVSFQAFKVCNAEGVCASADIVRALMRTLGLVGNNPKTLVHMSLGGPLPSKPEYHLLRLLGLRHGVPAIVSAGNGAFAPAHFPASFSSGLPTAINLSLPNVIPIAAVGFKESAGGYTIAGFNTRANAVLFAPGVNLCPQTASFRCEPAQPFPNNVGVTGTSFAAPVATGLAALYTEAKGSLPTRLGRCLANNTKRDPKTQIGYIAFSNKACP